MFEVGEMSSLKIISLKQKHKHKQLQHTLLFRAMLSSEICAVERSVPIITIQFHRHHLYVLIGTLMDQLAKFSVPFVF